MKSEIITMNGLDCYEENGIVYLRLEAVARGLGFTQTQNKNGVEYTSIRWETVNRYLERFGFPNKLGKDDFIPENIFYRLAMKANSETAEKFQAWVADEVIPSIRKHGAYMTPEVIEAALLNPDFGIRLLTELKAERERNANLSKENAALISKNQEQQQLIQEMQPIVNYYDTILMSTGTMATTQIAKDYGMTAIALNNELRDGHIQYKVNGQWVLLQRVSGLGIYRFPDDSL